MKKRIEWIDSLRGFAMFFVIFGHAFYIRNNFIRNYIYSFHMPLFFFISGLTYKRKDISYLDYLKKKIKNLLLPYLCLNIFVFIFKIVLNLLFGLYRSTSLMSAIEFTIKGYSNLIPCIQSWFILSLFIIDIIFFTLTKVFKKDYMVTIFVIIIFILGILYLRTNYTFLQYWHIDTSLVGLIFYYFGYILMKYYEKIKSLISNYKSLIFVIIALPLGYYIQSINGRISMNANRYNNIIEFLGSSMLTILSLVIICIVLLKKDILFNKVGRMSMFYLGYHGFIITPMKTFAPDILTNHYLTFLMSLGTFLVLFPIAKLAYKYVPITIGKFKGEDIT